MAEYNWWLPKDGIAGLLRAMGGRVDGLVQCDLLLRYEGANAITVNFGFAQDQHGNNNVLTAWVHRAGIRFETIPCLANSLDQAVDFVLGICVVYCGAKVAEVAEPVELASPEMIERLLTLGENPYADQHQHGGFSGIARFTERNLPTIKAILRKCLQGVELDDWISANGNDVRLGYAIADVLGADIEVWYHLECSPKGCDDWSRTGADTYDSSLNVKKVLDGFAGHATHEFRICRVTTITEVCK